MVPLPSRRTLHECARLDFNTFFSKHPSLACNKKASGCNLARPRRSLIRVINTTLLTDCALDKSPSSYLAICLCRNYTQLISRPTLPFSGSAMCLLSAAASHAKCPITVGPRYVLFRGSTTGVLFCRSLHAMKVAVHGDCFLSRDLAVNLDHDKNSLSKHP